MLEACQAETAALAEKSKPHEVAVAGTVAETESKPEQEHIKRTHVALEAGVLLGDLTGGTLALPIRIGLFTIKEREIGRASCRERV